MYKRRRRTFIGSVIRFTNKQFPKLIIILTGAILAYIAWIIYTTPEPYIDNVPDGQICLVDDLPEDTFDYSSFTSYEELFPDGSEYGKDGEVLIEEDSILSAIPDISLNLAPIPYFPSVVPTVPPDINKPPVHRLNGFPVIPFTIPYLHNQPPVIKPHNSDSVCVPAIPVDEPSSLYLMTMIILLRIFIKHD